jgi:isopenicillin N synthase-like dioxygenase
VEWADLEELDLRLLDSTDPEVRSNLVAGAKKALTVDGFLFVTGTGVSSETLERNLAIAQHAISGISQEEKLPYAAQLDRGSYVGYKLRGIWQQQGGVSDNIEVCHLIQWEKQVDGIALQPRISLVRGRGYQASSETTTIHPRNQGIRRTYLPPRRLPNPEACLARSRAA